MRKHKTKLHGIAQSEIHSKTKKQQEVLRVRHRLREYKVIFTLK